MKDCVELDWSLLGAKLVNLSDNEQADFFKGFAYELSTWESNYKVQVQMFFVRDKLKENDKKALETALSCLWYKEDKK